MGSSDLSTLDLVCRVMDTRLRPLDFSLVLDFIKSPNTASLIRGELSARNLYPATGSRVDGKEWSREDSPRSNLDVRLSEDGAAPGHIQEFLRLPFRLDREVPVRQLLIHDEGTGSASLVTRVHHAAGDLLSTLMWVCHQRSVATGRRPFVGEPARFEDLVLFDHRHRVRKGPRAYRGRCDPIWTRPAAASATRKWKTLEIRASDFSGLSRNRDGFTYNDLLLTSVLETLQWWNVEHGVGGRKLGLWIPVNIRRDTFNGFWKRDKSDSRVSTLPGQRFASDEMSRGSTSSGLVETERRMGCSQTAHLDPTTLPSYRAHLESVLEPPVGGHG